MRLLKGVKMEVNESKGRFERKLQREIHKKKKRQRERKYCRKRETALKTKKIKNNVDMTATANFRQVAQYIGLAVCGLIVRTAFGMFGILLGIISEIVNGLFQVAIGIIVAILSTIAFFGLILWLFTL